MQQPVDFLILQSSAESVLSYPLTNPNRLPMKLLATFAISLSLFTFATSHAKKLADFNEVDKGFVDIVHQRDDGKIFLRIDNLGDEFIYQTSLPSGLGSNDIGLDRGQLGETRLAVFEKVGNKVFLKQKTDYFRADTNNAKEAEAIDEAFASSILWGFSVEDSGKGWVLVDASDFILQDIHGVGRKLEQQKQGTGYSVDATRSAVDYSRTKAFQDNTELQATITLIGSKPGNHLSSTAPNPRAITLKMHHSFVRLPDDEYLPREFMPKSGYWAMEYLDYAQDINKNIKRQFIGRHRLEKKDPSLAMSEAVEPIIYYIDPGVPEPVRSALIDGALWWNSAFEEIGYKDAFQVKILPENADPMDIRYNVIQWVHRSTRGWSYGSSVIDPRTGEILKGHVTLGSLRVRQDYLIAQGMMAPFAESENDQALMDLALARIRQLSAHEVGHTLGLNHNFAASSYGRESVMDYPHPQFELSGTTVTAPNAYGVGLGKWDKAAIAFGYSEFSQTANVSAELRSIIENNDKNGLLYISDADARNPGSPHAAASLWDNGSDAVAELDAMIDIRSVALKNFGASNLKIGQNWSDLEEVLVPVYYFHRYQIGAAAKWIGGLNYDYGVKTSLDSKPTLSAVSGNDQRKALLSMLTTLRPEFLALDPKVLALMVPKASENSRTRESLKGKAGVGFDQHALAAASAQHTLSLLLHPQRLTRLGQQHAMDSKVPSINAIANILHDEIIDRNFEGISANLHQTVVDLIYSNYINLLRSDEVDPLLKGKIMSILNDEQRYLSKKRGQESYEGFYQYQSQRLETFTTERSDVLINLPKMPPGSPI